MPHSHHHTTFDTDSAPPKGLTNQPSRASDVSSPFLSDPAAQAVVARMKAKNPHADPLSLLPDIHPERLPRHIAIIMDGNGRWATQRGFPRIFGHRNGAAAVRAILETVGILGLDVLTLYSFSLENWKRPADEIDSLMHLYALYMEGETQSLIRENIRFLQIGRRTGLPPEVLQAVDRLTAATAHCTGPTLCVAVNYSSRAEIVDAARTLARKAAQGLISPDHIDEQLFSNSLYTADLPDPDLLIRTAGEMRLSNYLLWQISYAELHITPTLWPDFSRDHLLTAIRDYASRSRRFGGLSHPPTP